MKMQLVSSGILLLLQTVVIFATTRTVKKTDVRLMKKALIEQLEGSINPDPTNERGHAFALPSDYVRLSFHACPGKCDGCVNLRQKANRGLETPIYVLRSLYNTKVTKERDPQKRRSPKKILGSFADFIALAGITSLEFTAKRQCPVSNPDCSDYDKPKVVFRHGRQDCDTAPFDRNSRPMPDNHGNYNHVVTYFRDNFGFNATESVAILGAHTLGFCSKHISGYLGAWVSDVSKLDNNYYQVMQNKMLAWSQRDVSSINRRPAVQWNPATGDAGTDALMMLNPDIALTLDFKVDAKTGRSSCRSAASCPRSPGARTVARYARNNALWMTDFSAAFQKMIENGYGPGDLNLPV